MGWFSRKEGDTKDLDPKIESKGLSPDALVSQQQNQRTWGLGTRLDNGMQYHTEQGLQVTGFTSTQYNTEAPDGTRFENTVTDSEVITRVAWGNKRRLGRGQIHTFIEDEIG